MKYTENTLQSWTVPLSETEENRVKNTIRMIDDAIRTKDALANEEIEIFTQGSYANNTNVRQNSDIDVCIMLKSYFYTNYEDGVCSADFGYTDGGPSFNEFRELIMDALEDKFGSNNVNSRNKCIDVRANSYHVNADVVPAIQYRDYKIIHSRDKNRFVEGIKFLAQDGSWVINYPKDHINNGKTKNIETSHKYKKLVRIMKHIRNEMVSEGIINGEIITSFLVECLVWNIPNSFIMKNDNWTDTIQDSIAYLWHAIEEGKSDEWGEVSERLYLFKLRKWSSQDAKDFLAKMYAYLEFN